jgi:hypothetical protein
MDIRDNFIFNRPGYCNMGIFDAATNLHHQKRWGIFDQLSKPQRFQQSRSSRPVICYIQGTLTTLCCFTYPEFEPFLSYNPYVNISNFRHNCKPTAIKIGMLQEPWIFVLLIWILSPSSRGTYSYGP